MQCRIAKNLFVGIFFSDFPSLSFCPFPSLCFHFPFLFRCEVARLTPSNAAREFGEIWPQTHYGEFTAHETCLVVANFILFLLNKIRKFKQMCFLSEFNVMIFLNFTSASLNTQNTPPP